METVFKRGHNSEVAAAAAYPQKRSWFNGLSRNAVTSAADSNNNVVLPGETYACDYIGSTSTARNDHRSPIDHGVGNGAGRVIALFARENAWPRRDTLNFAKADSEIMVVSRSSGDSIP